MGKKTAHFTVGVDCTGGWVISNSGQISKRQKMSLKYVTVLSYLRCEGSGGMESQEGSANLRQHLVFYLHPNQPGVSGITHQLWRNTEPIKAGIRRQHLESDVFFYQHLPFSALIKLKYKERGEETFTEQLCLDLDATFQIRDTDR